MTKPLDPEQLQKEKVKEDLKKAAYARKINNQYKILKDWDTGKITGIEAIEAIESEGKVFRMEDDLFKKRK